MVESMVMASNGTTREHEDAYAVFYFTLGITIAHELVHCFTNFLSGTEEKDTPTEIAGFVLRDRSSTRKFGDSGALWELLTLGGRFETYKIPGNPLLYRQAGAPWLRRRDGSVQLIILLKDENKRNGHGMLVLRDESARLAC
jgi:hypothetical protein